MARRHSVLILAALATALIAAAAPATAHATTQSGDGKLRFVYGWVGEPATTDIPNRVLLRVLDNATNEGLLVDFEEVDVSLHLGDQEMEVTMVPLRGAAVGNYTSEEVVAPSQSGIYELHVTGPIAGSDVDVEIAANEELTDLDEIRWPPVQSDGARIETLERELALLKAQVETLNAKLASQATSPATTTPQASPSSPDGPWSSIPGLGLLFVVGAVAAVAAVAALRRRQ